MYPHPKGFRWYLALAVLFLFVLKSPVVAGHLAHSGGELLSATAGALSKLVRAM
jgi:hypothetical protein